MKESMEGKMPVVKIQSTSKVTASATPLILRKNEVTRLLFRPELVENIHDKSSPVRGTFVFQRKSPKGKWEDFIEQKLSELKAGEGFSLMLHTRELAALHNYIGELLETHKKLGGIISYAEFELTPKDVASALKNITNPGNADIVLEKLQQLDVDSVEKLNVLVGVSNLKKVLTMWEQNSDNDDENFWQRQFRENAWILSQVFAHPVVILQERAYVGGKSLSNTGGNLVDFIYRNELTNNVALIEIKTPKSQLMQTTRYRDNVVAVSTELNGAVGQILNYKHELQKSTSDSGDEYHVFDPKGVIVIGNLKNEQMDSVTRKSFELFRRQLKDAEVVTFDELFQKLRNMMNLLESGEWGVPATHSENLR